jgi:molybdopterin-binding protein
VTLRSASSRVGVAAILARFLNSNYQVYLAIVAREPLSSFHVDEGYRIGEAAEIIGVRVETLRRWERQGKLTTTRTAGGQRRIPAPELSRLVAERRDRRAPAITGQSLRNRFPGVVVAVNKDKVAATVEIMAGPHRMLSLLTREAVDELALKPGMRVIAAVKATNLSVEVPR